ncbi:MAG: cation transporter [Nitrospinae bacterium]|nr:cation transporter [Nitrospinota bacterium]
MSGHGGSFKVIILALLANLGIALSKFAGALYTGSASLFAEAIHSSVDCGNQALLLVGIKASARPPSPTHQLGYGREAFFWSFMVAIMLFTLGGAYSVYEGAHKLSAHEPIESPVVALAILAVGVVLESISFKACLNEVRQINRFGGMWEWFKKTTNTDLLVVFTEDLAALLGLVIAASCVTASWITGDSIYDAAGSIIVGTLLIVVAATLGVEIKSLLIGESPATDYRPGIEPIMAKHIPGGKVIALIALQTGASEVMVSYKVTHGRISGARELIDAINAVERDVKTAFPEIRWQFVEPDIQE